MVDARRHVQGMSPTEHVCTAREDEIYCFVVIGDKNNNTIYSVLPGQFSVQSYEGMCYIVVAYDYKLDYIMLRAMKSRENAIMITAFKSIYSKLEGTGHKLKLNILDNWGT